MTRHNQLDLSEEIEQRRRELIIRYNRRIAESALKYCLEPAVNPLKIFTRSIIRPSLPATYLDIIYERDPKGRIFRASNPGRHGVVNITTVPGLAINQIINAGAIFAEVAPHLQTVRKIIDYTNSHLSSGGEGGVPVGTIGPFDSPLTGLIRSGTRVLSEAYSLSADQYRLNPFDIDPKKNSFHKTPVARNLLTHANEIGISISSRAQDDMLFPVNHHLGNPYSKLSRALCRSIEGYPTDDIRAVGDMRPTGDGPTDLLLSLAHQIRRRNQNKHSGYGFSHDYDELIVDNCSEAEPFFVDYINYGDPKVRTNQSNGVRFITKEPKVADSKFEFGGLKFGEPTSLNLDPVIFNGIEIPPGFIFSEEGFVPLRASAFCFDYDTAVNTFGQQLTRSGPDAEAAFKKFAKLRDSETN